MSTVRRLALVVAITGALIALSGSAQAQMGPSNPSGGTSLRQTTLEGSGSFSPAGVLSRDLSFQTAWGQSWFGAFTASRFVPSVVGWTDRRSLSAVARRPAARR